MGALRGPPQFALLGPGRGGAAIRSRPLRAMRFRCTLFSVRHFAVQSRARACSAATPCSVLDADPPRLVVVATAGGAFTGSVPTSDVPFRPAGTAVSAPSRPAAAARRASVTRRAGVHPRDQDRPTVPPEGSTAPSSPRERMEERPETPFVVSCSCQLAHDRCGIAAAPTRCLAAPDKIEPLTRHL
jgi:hypothetical protein